MRFATSLRFSARTNVMAVVMKFSLYEKFTIANTNKTRRKTNLKIYPREFIDLLEPFYANQPKIIRDRWKTVCVAAKRSGLTMDILSWDSVGQAWKDAIRFYKRGKIKNSTDDGIGAYFYGVLCDYLLNDCLRSLA